MFLGRITRPHPSAVASGEHRLPACSVRPLRRMHSAQSATPSLQLPDERVKAVFAASRREQQASSLCPPEKTANHLRVVNCDGT
jgi:hypothetical protein